jgi:hypothetical protein
VANNLTVESPNFEKIVKEAGQNTSDAIALLWSALNDTRKTERMDFRRAKDMIAPKVLILEPSASVDDRDTEKSSVVVFQGASSQNLTGFRAPETGECRVLIVSVIGAGTITVKHDVTSEAQNRISTTSGADVTLATGSGIILAYLGSKWREVA